MKEQEITSITVLDKDDRSTGAIYRTELPPRTGEPRRFEWRYGVSASLKATYTADDLRQVADILDRRNGLEQPNGEVKSYE